MSSVILSEPIEVNKFSIIYAGAQKNIGPAGLTIDIINKEFMEMGNKNLPKILKYSEHSKLNSMLNTPPTFSWYIAGKVFKWMINLGGLDYFEKQNKLKASLLYNFIDNSDFYENTIIFKNTGYWILQHACICMHMYAYCMHMYAYCMHTACILHPYVCPLYAYCMHIACICMHMYAYVCTCKCARHACICMYM